ncbi:MAG: carbohydrate ABC transporter permease [Dehalococcoidales bacterium]|nr:carbohydrate ABC transporter permease [Dehalococcoidales bacterium]
MQAATPVRTLKTRSPLAEFAKKALIYLVLIAVGVVMAFPFYYMVSLSLSSMEEIFNFPPPLIPKELLFSNYLRVWEAAPFERYMFNSLLVACSVAAAHMFFDSLAGFVFAKYRFPGRDAMFMAIVSTLILPFFVRMIPLYLIAAKLGWVNTYQGLIFPFVMSGYGIFLMRQFIKPIPNELLEAARSDGCGEFGTYWRIVLPQCKPVLATDGLFTFIYQWNNFLWPLIITTTVEMKTLPLGLVLFKQEQWVQWNYMAGGALILFLPALLMFLLAQRYFVQGIVLSGMK